ncbi:fas-binding factor 1 isoform X3 [Columba livia]|uniref:fas-binding factor 1 isoform X3 n=1 Tax=Columba livia TaxID=8932 RepID=UPI0031BA9B00
MAAQAKKSLRGSSDDILDDLLGSEDEPSVKSTRASQAAGSSSGRAWNPSVQTSKKSVLEDDFYSKLAVEAAEGSSTSDVQSLGDVDDLAAEILGIPEPGSGPLKTPMKGPGISDSSRGAEKTTRKLPAAGKDLLSDKEQDAPKKAAPTSSKSSCDRKPEESKGKESPQTPLRTTAPAQRRKELMFEDDNDDDMLEALGFGSGKKEEKLRPARSMLDELFGGGSAAKVLEELNTGERRDFKQDEKSQKQPEKKECWDKEDLIFGEYQPSMGSRPSRRQSVSRFTAENMGEPKAEPRSKPSPPASQSPVRRRGSRANWLGLKDEDFFDSELPSPVKTSSTVGITPSPASQLPAAEEAAAKTGPEEQEDWLMAALARKRAQAQAKAEKREAEPLEAMGEWPCPRSPLSQPAASPAAAQPAAAPQDTAAGTGGSRGLVPWLSTVKPASVSPSDTAKEDPSGDDNTMVPTPSLPGEKEIPDPAPLTQTEKSPAGVCLSPSPQAEAPALDVLPEKRLGAPAAQLCEETSGCRAELLSVKAHVAELEGKVQTLEMLQEEQKLLLESVQRQHQEDQDLLKSTHRTLMKVQEETHRQQEDMLRWQKEQLLAQMEKQRQDAEQERAELLEQHRLDLEQLREMQRASVQKLWKDYEEQIQHLKWLKEREMDVVTSAISHIRSLNGDMDLHDLDCKVEATHHSASQELATKAQQWDKQLRMLRDRLSQQQKDREEEWMRLQELAAKREARLDEQTRLMEREQAELKIRGQELKAKEEQLRKDQERLDEAWKELWMEKEKVNDAVLHVELQEEEVEKLLAQKIAEAHRIELEHQARLQDVLQNLEQLKQQQQQRLHQGSVPSAQDLGAPSNGPSSAMAELSRVLWVGRDVLGRSTQSAVPLTAAAPWAPVPDVPPLVETPPRHRFRDIGEVMAVADRALLSAQVQTLRFHIQKEKYLLENEKLFKSMKKAPCNTSSPLASRPSFSGL